MIDPKTTDEGKVCGPCSRGMHYALCDGPNDYWGDCECACQGSIEGAKVAI